MPAFCFAEFTAFALLATAPQASLEWPWGSRIELPSPDGRHIVYGEPYEQGVRQGPELWLRRVGRPERTRLLQLGSTARAFWFPDGRNFLVVDRKSSSSMNSYVYDLSGRIVLDARAALLQRDSELGAVANGHFYVEAQRMVDSDKVRVAAYGHTDEPPVHCFRFIYTITRGGSVVRLSKRISPASASVCDEQSE